MNKLTICVYQMAAIQPEVSGITGLDNYNLSGKATFDKETGQLLNIFLERLPKPLCLVAHNGDSYDFPMLKAELEKAGVMIPYDSLCADSYVGIKDIFKRSEHALQIQNKLDFICIGNPTSYSPINLHKHLLGYYPIQSHGEEVDCSALMRTIAVLGIEWVNWVKENCQLFSKCTKMWSFQKSWYIM